MCLTVRICLKGCRRTSGQVQWNRDGCAGGGVGGGCVPRYISHLSMAVRFCAAARALDLHELCIYPRTTARIPSFVPNPGRRIPQPHVTLPDPNLTVNRQTLYPHLTTASCTDRIPFCVYQLRPFLTHQRPSGYAWNPICKSISSNTLVRS